MQIFRLVHDFHPSIDCRLERALMPGPPIRANAELVIGPLNLSLCRSVSRGELKIPANFAVRRRRIAVCRNPTP
jgi:hypothetical protein